MIFNSYIEEDFSRMKRFYPENAAKINRLVEKACDNMEYEGSRMYDEVPDRDMVRRICEDIYNEFGFASPVPETEPEDGDDVFAMSYQRNNNLQAERLLRELIMVMLYSEMHSRRCFRNQCRRRNDFY